MVFARILLMTVMLVISSGQAFAQLEETSTDTGASAISAQTLPDEGRYVYLATTLHLLDGVTPDLVDGLRSIGERALMRQETPQDIDALNATLNDPLLLQADPASIVAQAASVIDAGFLRREEIAATLAEMEAQTPAFDDPLLALAILDNGVRFRFALAQALYATEVLDLPRAQQDAIARYSEDTYGLRDEMELLEFEIAVDGLTDEALAAQRNAYASLQRGVLSEIDPYSFVEDGNRAARMTSQARDGINAEMRTMLLQILLIGAVVLP